MIDDFCSKLKRMKTFEQDQEYGNRWSSFLDLDSFFGPISFSVDNNEENGFIYHDQYLGGYRYDNRNYSYIEHNELNQEQALPEISQLGVGEAVEISNAEDQICTPDAPSHGTTEPYTNYWPAHEVCEQVVDDNEPSTSCSSPGEILYDGEDFSQYLELADDSALDGELGKRLNQIIPVPHVPRTNGEIPSIDEATSDHQRLLDRLELYNLDERKVQGDGNCQELVSSFRKLSCLNYKFRALSDQFYRSPEHHKFVRQQVVNQLKSNPEDYDGYVTMEYYEYLEKMSKCGEWGDHVTLQAAADSYGVKIFVITSFKDTCYIEILPKVEKSERVIFLSFWAEVHYNSIYPQGESPPCDISKKKKRWWSLRQKH